MTQAHKTTWILVCDGARGRIFTQPRPLEPLSVVSSAEHPESHGHTRDLGSDKPGRTQDSSHSGARHSMAPRVDWHAFEKTRFAQEMAAVVEKAATAKAFDQLILVAPPRVLGDLRQALGSQAAALLAGDLDKDLTNLDGPEIAGHLGAWLRF